MSIHLPFGDTPRDEEVPEPPEARSEHQAMPHARETDFGMDLDMFLDMESPEFAC